MRQQIEAAFERQLKRNISNLHILKKTEYIDI